MLLALLAAVCSLVLPNWLLLALLPILIVLANAAAVLPPVVSVGPADLQVYDVVLLVSALKLVLSLALRPKFRWTPVVGAVLGFLGTLLFANLVSYLKFGSANLLFTSLTLARLTLEAAIIGIMAFGIRQEWQIHAVARIITALGILIAANIYGNALFYPLGLTLGEIQGIDSGIVRSFGIVGDQAGFLLTFFVLKGIVERKLLQVGFFAGAIVLTGTIGAMLSLLVGVLVLIGTSTTQPSLRLTGVPRTRRYVIGVAGLGVIVLAATVAADFGGILSRVTGGSVFSFTGLQRLLSAQLALRIVADNVLTGVGYVGLPYVADRYGASELFVTQLGDLRQNYVANAGNQWLQTMADGGVFALVAAVALVIVLARALRLAASLGGPGLEPMFTAGAIWLISMAVGNLTAVWMLPGSLISLFLWLIVGLAVAVNLRTWSVPAQSQPDVKQRTRSNTGP